MKCLKYLVWGNTETCQGPTFCDLCWWPRLERMWRLAKAREGPGPLVYPLTVDSPLQPWWGRLWIGTYNLRKSWPRILKPTNPFQKNSIRVMMTKGFPVGSAVKNSPANVGDAGLIPGLGRSLEEGMTIHSSILAWETPWTEKPGGLQATGSQRVRHNLAM